MASIKLPILAFNDVYRATKQKYTSPAGHGVRNPSEEDSAEEGETISAAQFGRTLLDIRNGWKKREEKRQGDDGDVERDGLVLFAGDVFNPSVESSVTRGSHMVPLLNHLKLDASCVGNHDLDHGFPHLCTLMAACDFPWLLSNIVDTNTGTQPEGVRRFWVTERCGVNIGVIGLVEKDWIATIPSWPENFQHRDMVETGLALSKELRDPNGEHKVDLIIALTHCRLPNDIDLANALGAVAKRDTKDEHGVDLLIGGHDHIYYIGKGADEWEGFAREENVRGSEKDEGVRLVKSGTDFRDLSELVLSLKPTTPGSVRTHVVESLTGKHHETVPSTPTSKAIEDLIASLLSTVTETLSRPVCFTLTPLDVRSEKVRVGESAIGNWVADILLHAYSEMGEKVTGENTVKREHSADAVLICGGTLRGDSQYGPGKVKLGDILEILPFDDPVVCLEIDGAGLWAALEAALSKWPAQEGRFPVISGLRVTWDHTKRPNQRVLSVHLLDRTAPKTVDPEDDGENPDDLVNFVDHEDGTTLEVKQRRIVLGDEIKNEEGGRLYRVITRAYMSEGYDGFTALKGRNFIVDDDNGQIMSSIVRSFLLGSAYIWRHKQLQASHGKHVSTQTDSVINKARNRYNRPSVTSPTTQSPSSSFILAKPQTISSLSNASAGSATMGRHVIDHSESEIRDALHVARMDHMSEIDTFDGATLRAQRAVSDRPSNNDTAAGMPVPQASFLVNDRNRETMKTMDSELAIVSPLIDGRMRDVSEGRP